MSAPPDPTTERVWTCSTHDKWFTKPRLIELANDLRIEGVSAQLLKPQILKLVDDHLNAASPVLSLQKKYQGLFAYKKSSTIDGTARGPHNGLTSAGKDMADVAAQAAGLSGDSHITPSHNILQALLKTSDPPGRNMTFQTSGVLTSQPDVDDPAAPHASKLRRGLRSSDSDSSDASSLADSSEPQNQDDISGQLTPQATPSSPLSDKSDADSTHVTQGGLDATPLAEPVAGQLDETALWPSTPKKKKHEISVVFRDPRGKAAPEEAWILCGPGGIPLEKTQSASGNREQYTARLSDLVPAVLAKHTPMKKGRIARPPVQRDGYMVDIGSVKALAKGRMKYLSMAKINDYDLEVNDEGNLVCELFWQREDDPITLPTSTTSLPTAGASVPPSETDGDSDHPVSEAVSASEEDPELQRPKASIYHKSKSTSSRAADEDEQFLQYLRSFIGNPSASSKVKTSYDALKIHRVIREAERVLDNAGWSLLAKMGGFVVPPTNKNWAGKSFTRELVYKACYVSRSSATQYKKLFKTDGNPESLKTLADWIEKPDDPVLMRKFGNSSIRQLAEWKEKKLREPRRKAGQSLKDVKGKSKRTHSSSESEDGVPSTSASRRVKKPKQHAAAIDSDALDSE